MDRKYTVDLLNLPQIQKNLRENLSFSENSLPALEVFLLSSQKYVNKFSRRHFGSLDKRPFKCQEDLLEFLSF